MAKKVLIESDWNLKEKAAVDVFIPFSINRIRLEFKDDYVVDEGENESTY